MNLTDDFKAKIKRICLVCKHNGTTHETKKEHKDIIPCPKCNGSFIDAWVKHKYARNNNKPLLIIELEDEHSTPKVLYKGEEIKAKVKINFDWRTKELRDLGGLEFNLEYGDDKGITHKVGRKKGDF